MKSFYYIFIFLLLKKFYQLNAIKTILIYNNNKKYLINLLIDKIISFVCFKQFLNFYFIIQKNIDNRNILVKMKF